ncbi:fructose PTS transporter subunit IIA [Lactiplantibacillus sp. DA1]|uniref:PTS sugar transporter subunit IIA n=1 Tax=Lactiplantibacillus sp. DA1 TaxID=3079857 RepID=UPI00292A65D7|nr:fructose PTS transporter subunit IIA [Lactiplantibacillus sp. DA1]MDV0431713.1 fructose PTS transporter subunit IIA [Lactiplantibacillus sp. DA1]
MEKIIVPNLINLDLKANNKQAAIKQLGCLLNDANRLRDYDAYIKNVQEREALTTTGIGFGIAIPHGKTNAVKEISVAFGRLHNPIEWESLDGKPVSMIFQLAVPESSCGDEHLRLISALSRQLIHEEFRQELQKADSSEEVLKIIGSSLESKMEV